MKRTFFLLLAHFLMSFSSWGEVSWENKTLEFHPALTDTQVIAPFKFQNTGKEPIFIKSITSSCACTTATTSKESYADGEKGEVIATFNIGSRIGLVEKTIRVKINDAPDIPLTLRVQIPSPCQIEPQALVWHQGEKADAKKIEINANDGFEIKSLDVRFVDRTADCFDTEVNVKEVGKQYEISVHPKEPARPTTNKIVLHINRGLPNAKIYFRQVIIE